MLLQYGSYRTEKQHEPCRIWLKKKPAAHRTATGHLVTQSRESSWHKVWLYAQHLTVTLSPSPGVLIAPRW